MGSGELRRRRATGQLLVGDATRPVVEVVRSLLAVQAQDFISALLALRARSAGMPPGALDAALGERSVVMSWLCRGTLHLVASEDWPWLLALIPPARMAEHVRRLGEEGVPPDAAERALAAVERALAGEGPLARGELRDRVAAVGVRSEGQAMPHLLALAALRGRVVLCGESRFALAREWLGEPRPVPREDALRELGLRYRRAHPVATPQDLAAWSGLPLRDAHAAWAGSSERDVEPSPVAPRLLPPFDPYMLGWKDRSFAIPEALRRRVVPGGGMLRATALDDGKVVGTWTRPGGRVALHDGAPLRRFESEARDVERILGAR